MFPKANGPRMLRLSSRLQGIRVQGWRQLHGAREGVEGLVSAEIVEVKDLTPSIKELRLCVEGSFNAVNASNASNAFSFKAGNWVDFFIDQDGVSKVGGYSMSSIPSDLPQLRLAVKSSKHPPAQWCHTLAKPGKRVKLAAGGSFYFDAEEHGTLKHLVLIAGGIGINPIFSMLKEAYFYRQKLPCLDRVSLFYSASKPSELAYRSELQGLADVWSEKLRLELRVTRDEGDGWNGACGRLNMEHLRPQLPTNRNGLLVYLCGPPAMTDQLVGDLERDGLGQALRYEKWWWKRNRYDMVRLVRRWWSEAMWSETNWFNCRTPLKSLWSAIECKEASSVRTAVHHADAQPRNWSSQDEWLKRQLKLLPLEYVKSILLMLTGATLLNVRQLEWASRHLQKYHQGMRQLPVVFLIMLY